MKATVVEKNKDNVVLLREDGVFVRQRYPQKDLKIGEVLVMKEVREPRKRLKLGLVFSILFAIILGLSAYAYYTPAYYVSVDVNPGIVMEVNMFERVIGVDGVNTEADEVLVGLSLQNMKVDDAALLMVEKIHAKGYLEEEANQIMIATATRNQAAGEKLAEKIRVRVQEQINEEGILAQLRSETVGYELVQAAKAIEGMTPGKYNLLVNILDIDPADVDDYANVSIKDLMRPNDVPGNGQTSNDDAKPDDTGSNNDDNDQKPSDTGSDNANNNQADSGNNGGRSQ
ncbi:MAG: hypothetical protein PHN21_04855 [Erysipelotrichaceae bacterium]|nr:hypothetical protein [Erysipelotrichaceae bacterium]